MSECLDFLSHVPGGVFSVLIRAHVNSEAVLLVIEPSARYCASIFKCVDAVPVLEVFLKVASVLFAIGPLHISKALQHVVLQIPCVLLIIRPFIVPEARNFSA